MYNLNTNYLTLGEFIRLNEGDNEYISMTHVILQTFPSCYYQLGGHEE